MEQKTFDARQLEQLKTVTAVLGVCQKNLSVVAQMPKFKEKYELLKAKNDEVTTQSITKHQANANQGGIITDLGADRIALETLVSDNVPLFTEFCNDTNNSALKSMLSSLTLSKLRKQKPLDLVTNLQSFILSAKTIDKKQAAEYGITETWMNLVADKTKNYNDALPLHASIKQSKPQATVNLRTYINNLMAIKASMDNLVMGFKNTHPEFFAEYNLAKIVNRPTVKAAVKKAQLLKSKASAGEKKVSESQNISKTVKDKETPSLKLLSSEKKDEVKE